ncbi:PREDICTED: uncharacterized protein LOC104791728 [Camelina sativa]|uniref:Uncharacterized protein LOC104791728 n=1 Tax=Camelina sativa TaxID=90675 RepID=A0ABM0ZHZ2_CAMSA|nr:PREDICTED: uncharacterized protein LOC104791728 [Camelina sativa]
MIKRCRPSMLPQPMTPAEKHIVAKVTGGSPNYMKGTISSEVKRKSQGVQVGSDMNSQSGNKLDISCSGNKKQSWSPNYMKGTSSSEARRQRRQGVQVGSDKKSQTGKKLDISSSGIKKQSSSSSSSSSLKKVLSFKRSCRIGRCCDQATCSSFLRNSKFTEDLMLASPNDLKVCHYTYCSLNAHLHDQFPPLKNLISARRRSMKSHANVKMSGDDGCVDIYVDGKKENGSTRDVVDIQVIDFEPEDKDMELGKAEGLESNGTEMVSVRNGEGIESGDENIGTMMIIILGNALDEELNSKKSEDCKEVDEEKVKERIELVSKTEETLLTLARKPCIPEECTESWREFNPREPNYLPITAEPSNETVELKHEEMDEMKNTEEWMTDYALQHNVSKLAVERKKDVALFVVAFETTLPRDRSPAFTNGRHLQACN